MKLSITVKNLRASSFKFKILKSDMAQTRYSMSYFLDKNIKKVTQTRKLMSFFWDKNFLMSEKKDKTHTHYCEK